MSLRVTVRRSLSLLRSVISRLTSVTKIVYFRTAFPEVRLPFSTTIDKAVRLSATDGGSIEVGSNVFLGPNTQVISRGGRIVIGDDVHIGTGSIIVSTDTVTIGRDTLIAEYVVIRDQDHDYSVRPIRTSNFLTGAIAIGEDCWLGCKSTVLRNSSIGNSSVIGAHSLVRGDVPPSTLAVGAPHRNVRELPPL
jgi:acetyltransferase-like isoleucine patch superfamily enzyme